MLNVALIGIIVLSTALIYHCNYEGGLAASLFLMVLLPNNLTIDISVSLPSLTVHRWILLVMLVAWMNRSGIKKELHNAPYLGILFWITFTAAVGTGIAPNLLVSTKRYLYLVYESFLFFVIVRSSLTDIATTRRVIRAVTAALTIVAVVGIIENQTGIRVAPIFGTRMTYDFEPVRGGLTDNPAATYLHPILFGTAVSIGMVHQLLLAEEPLTIGRRLRLGLYFVASGAALYFSQSRGPWLAAILAFSYALLISFRRMLPKLLFYGVVGVMLAIVVYPGVFLSIMSLYRATFDVDSIEGSSFQWRFLIWDLATTQIRQSAFVHRLFGYGGGSQLYTDFGVAPMSSGHTVTIESWDMEYAIILFERGIVGLVLQLILYSSVLLRASQMLIRRRPHHTETLIALLTVLIVAFMKTNVAIFAPQITYLEHIAIAIMSFLVSRDRGHYPIHVLQRRAVPV